MKTILLAIWKFLTKKEHLPYTIVVLIFLIMGTTLYVQREKIKKLKEEKISIENLNNALHDSITYYQNAEKEWVAEKATIQASIKELEKNYGKLTDSQKELIDRVKELDKKNTVIAAALIQSNVKIDSLLAKDNEAGNVVTIDTTKKMVNINNLAAHDSTFIYDIDVNDVLPALSNIKPSLLFKTIELPNKQFVDFYWKNDRKKGYPVSFTISNSNPYVKTISLDSYIIPNIDKKFVDPSGWQKFSNFIFKNGKTVLLVGAGVGVGAGIVWLTR